MATRKTSRPQRAGHDLAHPRRVVGHHRADLSNLAVQKGGTPTCGLAPCGMEGIIFRMRSGPPVGCTAQGVRIQEHCPRLVSTLEQGRCHGEDLGQARGELPGTRGRALGLAECRRRDGQAAFWGDCVGPNPTDRAKNGTKRSVIVDQDGGPLGATIDGANVHDTKLLKTTIEAIVVDRPNPPPRLHSTCAWTKATTTRLAGRLSPSITTLPTSAELVRMPRERKKESKRHKPRRWVVERTLGWL